VSRSYVWLRYSPFCWEIAMEGMMMFGALGPMMGIAPLFMLLPVGLYALAKWRGNKEDSQLGIKFGLWWLSSMAIMLVLVGVAALLYGVLAKGEKGALIRVAFGAILPGGIITGLSQMLLQKTNNASQPSVMRMYIGALMLQTGSIGFMAMAAFFQMLLAKGEQGEPIKMAAVAMIVFCGAMVALVVYLGKLSGASFGANAGGMGGGYGGGQGYAAQASGPAAAPQGYAQQAPGAQPGYGQGQPPQAYGQAPPQGYAQQPQGYAPGGYPQQGQPGQYAPQGQVPARAPSGQPGQYAPPGYDPTKPNG
jgi:hypothetical protein